MFDLMSALFSMGNPPAGEAPQGGMEQLVSFLMPMAIIFGIFYFLIIRPQMKTQKKHKELLDSLKKGDKVLTSGGIYGIVVGISDKENIVVVRIDENTKVEVARSFITGVKKEGSEIVIETTPK